MTRDKTPAELAAGFRAWAMADDRPEAEWVITRAEARALLALVERALELKREFDEAEARAERAEAALREIADVNTDDPMRDAAERIVRAAFARREARDE
jgi:hypothetical protein